MELGKRLVRGKEEDRHGREIRESWKVYQNMLCICMKFSKKNLNKMTQQSRIEEFSKLIFIFFSMVILKEKSHRHIKKK